MNIDPVAADTNRHIWQQYQDDLREAEVSRRVELLFNNDDDLRWHIAHALNAQTVGGHKLLKLFRDEDWIAFGEALKMVVREDAAESVNRDLDNEKRDRYLND